MLATIILIVDAIIRALKKGDRALSMIAEVYGEALEQWRKAKRKWPFAEDWGLSLKFAHRATAEA